MGERWSGYDVADRVDILFGRAHEWIDVHHAALIDLHFRFFQSAIFSHGAAAGGGENEIGLDGLLFSFEGERRLHAAVSDFAGVDFRVGEDFDSFFLHQTRELFRDLFVFDRKKLRHHFDDGRLRTEAREDRRELAADRAGADHEQRLRHFFEQKDVIGVDDPFAVSLDVRQILRHGTHRQDDVFRGEFLAVDVDGVAIEEFAEAGDAFDFVFLEEELDSFRILVDDGLLATLARFEVETHIANVDAEFFCLLDLVPHIGILEQRFGRNAAAMRTCPADERIFFDDRHLHPELTGANAGDISAGTAADDEDVVILISQDNLR